MKTLVKISAFFLMLASMTACSGELTELNAALLERDPRNKAVDFSFLKDGTTLTYCIYDLNGEASAADVFRILLQAADELKAESFETVQLCFRDEARFKLGGTDFKTIGEEFEIQNPMYTIRTFPEKLKTLTNEQAYSSHQGGLLYLMRVQMEDFNDMNGKWFLNDLLAEAKDIKDAQRPTEFASEEEVF